MPDEVVAPEVEPEAPETETPVVELPEKETPAVETVEEIDLEKEELKSKLAEARKDAEKKRKQKLEVQKAAGQYEELYTEAQTELQQAQTTVETLTAEKTVLEKEVKILRKERDDYRATLIDRFESDGDKALAKNAPLADIPALYERLYGKEIIQAPPSPGVARTATKVPENKPGTLADFFEKKYSKNGS